VSDLTKYWKKNQIEPWTDFLVLEREEPKEMSDGGIYIADEAQRLPVTGIVVACNKSMANLIGKRVYFRPGSEWMVPLGPLGEGPEATVLHYKDIKMVEVP
jgi:hypothetical protein